MTTMQPQQEINYAASSNEMSALLAGRKVRFPYHRISFCIKLKLVAKIFVRKLAS